MHTTMTKRQAIAEARALADDTIDQLTRLARGFDKGDLRDDSTQRVACFASPDMIPSRRLIHNSAEAMYLAQKFA